MTTNPNVQMPTVQTPKEITINVWAALGIIGGAILVSIVGTAFAAASAANSDHFLLQSTATAVSEIKTNQSQYVRSDVYEANQTAIETSLQDIKTDLQSIDQKLTSKE